MAAVEINDRVLVVDGDAAGRELICGVLESAGYATRQTPTGEEALELAREWPPGLVVLDVRLPGICGYEVCSKFRERSGEDVVIIFVSGDRTEPCDRVAGLLVGGDDYLVKPFAPDELVARARRLLRRAARPARSNLTDRELEVLRLLADGLSQDEIARDLVIRPKTVAKHIEHIREKLGAHSRAQVVGRAYREGVLRA